MYGISPFSMGGYGYLSNTYGNNANYYQNLKSQYGVGYEDFGSRPQVQAYPFAITPKRPEPILEKFGLIRFLKQCFS